MALIKVKPLGLAAYVKMHGAQLLEVTSDKFFVFDTDKTLDQWKTEYTNSCCARHDAYVCEMRYHLK